jgi:hypothetical protein
VGFDSNGTFGFSMRVIEILKSWEERSGVSMETQKDHRGLEVGMNCENEGGGIIREKKDGMTAPASRLTDEKISDESGTETTADCAMAPAGLKNPFWN